MLKPDVKQALETAVKHTLERNEEWMTKAEQVEFEKLIHQIAKRYYRMGLKHGREKCKRAHRQ